MILKAVEIFERSVKVMKEILPPGEMIASIKRAKTRTEEENLALLTKERENVNELVRQIANSEYRTIPQSVSQELIDSLVLRYLKNRDTFMKTFPDGIDDIETDDPLLLWGAMLISPQDVNPFK